MTDAEADLRSCLADYLEAVRPGDVAGVVGVLLTGSLPAGRADEYADLDLTVVLDDDPESVADASLVPDGVTAGRHDPAERYFDWRDVHVDLLLVDLDDLATADWDLPTRREYTDAEVLADPDGRLAALLDDRTAFDPDDVAAVASERAETFLWALQWDVHRCLRRSDPRAAHHLVTTALDDLRDLAFLAHGEFPPRPKWVVAELDALPLDDGVRADLEAARLVDSFDEADVRRRVAAAKRAWEAVRDGLVARGMVPAGGFQWENDKLPGD